ncbi:MAG: hypothetical protein KDK45_26210, partial [Leptospiraceae bacterium]|nr:hypothetical protein [Leptospiraceae bacterium]
YQMEFKNQNRFASIYKNSNIVYVPLPIQEASSQRVLSSEFVQAYDIHDIQKGNFEQSLLDLWGTNLYRSFIEQMFVHRFLHADPNIGNFAFRSDGQIILYDFGSVKVLPEDFVLSFKKILQHLLNKELSEMPQALKELGIYHADGRTIEEEITSEYGELMKPVFSKGGFSFAGERHIFKALIRVKEKYTWKLMDIQVPADLIFVNRTLIGLSGNLNA